MDRPELPPSEPTLQPWRAFALAFLRAELRDAAPAQLAGGVIYPASPLDGEGAVAIFEFQTTRAGESAARYAVVVGETEPNYYAVHDLTPEEIFELHLGTRFMLVLGVSQIPADIALSDADYDLNRDAMEIARRATNHPVLEDLALAAMFSVEDQKHAVIKAQLNGNAVYIMGRDAPLGFSTRRDLAAHIAYRLHIGHVLRREAMPELE